MEKVSAMREILFRGKCVVSNNWIYGTPVYYKSGEVSIYNDECLQYGYEGSRVASMRSKVIPETVGQFTGLLDKNGKKIFEGDILESGLGKKMLVIWRKDLSSFALTADGWMYDHYFGEGADPGRCNIIGNIHDNPELI